MINFLNTPGLEAMRTVRELRQSSGEWSWDGIPKPPRRGKPGGKQEYWEANLEVVKELTGFTLPVWQVKSANQFN